MPDAPRATAPTARAASGRPGPAASGCEIELDDGTTVTVDEAYLERAITDPAAEIHAGFSVTMPENQLTDEEIAQVIDYIVSLDGSTTTRSAPIRGFHVTEGLLHPIRAGNPRALLTFS